MPNHYFQFKQFLINQHRAAMKVTTDACLFGAWVASEEKNSKNAERILDIGTGTGLLSLMLAQQVSGKIDAIDIDHDAFLQASENTVHSPWKDRINMSLGDIKEIKTEVVQYDVIISNPPFYTDQLRSPDEQKNKAHHDSTLTLQELIPIMQQLLTTNGRFYLLLPFHRLADAKEIIQGEHLFISKLVLVRPSPAHAFFRIMIQGSNVESTTSVSEMDIRMDNNEYSKLFTELLGSYYLHL